MTPIFDCIYLALFIILLPVFLLNRKLRRVIIERTKATPPAPNLSREPVILFHCVSAGELAAAEGLIRAVSEELPQYKLAISTTTPQGMEFARRRLPYYRVVYFPPDFSWSVARFFGILHPHIVVLLELEIWPNFLKAAKERNIPILLANGRISPISYARYKMLKPVFRYIFQQLSLVLAQTEEYKQRFIDIGVASNKVRIGGNLKYDSVLTTIPEDEIIELKKLLAITPEQKVIVGGSTYSEEEAILIEIFKKLKQTEKNLRLIVAPRQLHRIDEVKQSLHKEGLNFSLVTTLRTMPQKCEDIVILDTTGELVRFYSLATVAFVGGSLIERGGHNILEPAALGVPTIFGPHTFNFIESTKLLLSANGAIRVTDKYELKEVIEKLLSASQLRQELGLNAFRAIANAKGAVKCHLVAIKSLL